MSSALPLVASSSSTSGPARPPPITASVSCPIQKSTVPVANYAAETTHLTLSMEKLLENAEATGELRLCCRNLKMFPKNCCKFHLEDTVMTGKLQSRSFQVNRKARLLLPRPKEPLRVQIHFVRKLEEREIERESVKTLIMCFPVASGRGIGLSLPPSFLFSLLRCVLPRSSTHFTESTPFPPRKITAAPPRLAQSPKPQIVRSVSVPPPPPPPPP